MTDNIKSIAGKRFAQATEAQQLKPRDALIEALRRIDEGDTDATHVMICIGLPNGSYSYLNSGSLDANGNVGLVARILDHLIRATEQS